MNAGSKLLALTIVAALLCVPALTRVHQRLQHSNSGTLISSYSKSAEAPPERLLGAPPALVISMVLNALATPPAPVVTPSPDEPLASRSLAPPDALRAPPLA